MSIQLYLSLWAYFIVGLFYTLYSADASSNFQILYKLKKCKTRLSKIVRLMLLPAIIPSMIFLNVVVLVFAIAIIPLIPLIFIAGLFGILFEELFLKLRNVKLIKWLIEDIGGNNNELQN